MPEADSKCPFCATQVPAGAVICTGCGAKYGYELGGQVKLDLSGIEEMYAPSQSVAKGAGCLGIVLLAISGCNIVFDAKNRGAWFGGVIFAAVCLLLRLWAAGGKHRQMEALRQQGPRWYR